MKKITLALAMAGCILLTSCDVLLQVANQMSSVANLANCDFSLKNVSNVSVAGVNVKNLAKGQLQATDVVKLVAAYQTKQVPLAMDVNVDITNPTTTQAAMTAMDWILAIDGSDMANGVSTKAYTILPSTTTTVPLGVNTDLGNLFSKQGLESLAREEDRQELIINWITISEQGKYRGFGSDIFFVPDVVIGAVAASNSM